VCDLEYESSVPHSFIRCHVA